MKSLLKNLGVILIIIGAVILIACNIDYYRSCYPDCMLCN